MAYEVETRVAGSQERKYSDKELVAVHINLPKLLWEAVDAMSKLYGTTKTNVVVRALNKEAFFARVRSEDPKARFWIEHGNGEREFVSFV